jgi:hypothetical protein
LKTPREVIEGYFDPLLSKIQSTAIYMGGDLEVNPWLSIDNYPAAKPANSAISFNTGASDYHQTRIVASWQGDSNISVLRNSYSTLT